MLETFYSHLGALVKYSNCYLGRLIKVHEHFSFKGLFIEVVFRKFSLLQH